jgi:hypothetical protein
MTPTPEALAQAHEDGAIGGVAWHVLSLHFGHLTPDPIPHATIAKHYGVDTNLIDAIVRHATLRL